MLAKLILVVTMAASALLGGHAGLQQEQAATFDGYYLHLDDAGQPSIWAETNGQAGLQTRPVTFASGAFKLDVPGDSRVIL